MFDCSLHCDFVLFLGAECPDKSYISDPRIASKKKKKESSAEEDSVSENGDEEDDDDDDDTSSKTSGSSGNNEETGGDKQEPEAAVAAPDVWREALQAAAAFVNDAVRSVLYQKDPTDQASVDAMLEAALKKHVVRLQAEVEAQQDDEEMDLKAEEEAERRCALQIRAARQAVLATSIAVSRSGAKRKELSLYRHLAELLL